MPSVIDKMNEWGFQKRPFLFLIDFENQNPLAYPLDQLPDEFRFSTPRHPVDPEPYPDEKKILLEKSPITFRRYKQAFDQVMNHLRLGNTYLLNLTFPTPIHTNLSLDEIFRWAHAPYRLLMQDRFVVFSPEPFVRVAHGWIYTYPMKGTIDAALPDAENRILQDPKETAEHHTIVDLLRNDLSLVATHVEVSRFRYIDAIRTNEKTLLQVSSEIRGQLTYPFDQQFGSLMAALLPAGSISGAPKQKTVEIIGKAETRPRGYFTGVFGLFDGKVMESAVMIRFIEKTESGLHFRSGGGITHLSDARAEYQEMIDKVYVPVT